MTLSVSHQFQPRQVIRSSELNTNTQEIVDYVNSLEGTLTGGIYALIPQGTKMVFYQASAPTGWTAVAVNDKFLRVVTAGSTGGTTGGTMAASTSLAHTHTLAHTHDLGNHTHSVASHQHDLEHTDATNGAAVASSVQSTRVSGSQLTLRDPAGSSDVWLLKNRTEVQGAVTSGTPSSNTSGAASSGTTSSSLTGAFAYADVIVATKD